MAAAIIFVIGCPAFSAAEAPAVPELRWDATSALGAAEQAYREGRYQDAIRSYTEAAKEVSEQSAAFLGRGMAHEMVNQTPKAIEDYKRAVEVDRKNYRAMENLAGIYERGGRYIPEAITLYRHALKLDPRPEWKENMAAWIAMLETRLQPQAASAVGCWHLANRKAKAGGVQEAEKLYTRAISLNPAMFQAYFNRGLLRRGAGNLRGAVADFEATVSLSPSFRGGFVQKGLTNEQMGDRAQARQDLEQAARVDPRDPEALYHLARFLENASELGRAAQLYQGALGLRPKPELRKLIVDRIAGLPAAIKSDTTKNSSGPDDRKPLW
jgi:tetratricopeptide (TPR) repeat protein